jgi:Domain of unknown function (DUF4434)
MKRDYRLSRMILLFAFLIFMVSCGDDNDSTEPDSSPDDDSDDDADDDLNDDLNDDIDDDTLDTVHDLDLVFVEPAFWLGKNAEDMARELDAMADEGIGGLIWRWTWRFGKTTYPSAGFAAYLDMELDDPLMELLSLADSRGLKVYLGLSAGRAVADYYHDAATPEFERVNTVLSELTTLYGAHESLSGFYIPYEFPRMIDDDARVLLSLIATAVHDADADYRVLMTLRYPGVPQWRVLEKLLENRFNARFSLDDIDDAEYRAAWSEKMTQACGAAGIDAILLSTRMGSRFNELEHARMDLAALTQARDRLGSTVEIHVQADLFDTLGDNVGMRTAFGPASRDRIDDQLRLSADGYAGFGWDEWRNADGSLRGMSRIPEPELFAKAEAVRENIINRTLRDRQLAPVINGQHPLHLYWNAWQEDACWLTGLYLAAESYHCAATGGDDACNAARATWRAIRRMADVSPKRGEVVRNWARYIYVQTDPVEPGSGTIKRWRKHPDEEVYWVGDISVDQLSGYMNGLATFYDLVANEGEREEIRDLTEAIMGDILANSLRCRQFDGQLTTFGKLSATPELAADFLMIAWHITSDQKYLDEFDRITYVEHWDINLILSHYVKHFIAGHAGNQHLQDSGLVHMFEYIQDPALYRRYVRGLEYVFQGSFLYGNSYANFTHQTHAPDSAGGARALGELLDFDPDLLDNAVWYREINRAWWPGTWVDMHERPAKEWMWSWAPNSVTAPRGTTNHRYTGVGFLLCYWQGRYYGWIR